LKGNVPQLEGIVKWTEIRLSNLPRNLFNHLEAIDSIGRAHDRFVVGDRRSFNEARAKVRRTVSSIEKHSGSLSCVLITSQHHMMQADMTSHTP
jgi:hypothetical protein